MPLKLSKVGDSTIIAQPSLVNIYKSTIGQGCKISAFVEIGGAAVGNRVVIEAFAYICPHVTIEDDVFIGPRVTFLNDKYPPSRGAWRAGKPTVVRQGSSIGAGAIILPGITIGRAARVAAGAVITRDVKDGELSYGAYGKGSSRIQPR